jgi:hypothetical protein
MHLEDEQIQRMLHGEFDGPGATAVQGHLASCAACRLELERATREEEAVFELLRRLDHAAPAVGAEAVAGRAVGRQAGWGRWAAAILLALGAAGIAYAMPGSPLRAWVARAAAWVMRPAAHQPSALHPLPIRPQSAGIAVVPGDRFVIRFMTTQAEGEARVTLTVGSEIVARAVNGRATFATEADRLTIENEGSRAHYEIELPRGAPRVEILVGPRPIFLKRGQQLVTDVPPDTQGRYILPLTP